MKISPLPLVALLSVIGTSVMAAPATPPAGKPGMVPGKMGGAKMGGGMRRGRGMEKLAQALGLTDAQKTKLKSMMEAQRPAMMALRTNTSLTPDQKRAKFKTMRAANDKKLMTVLTPAQRKKFMTMMQERRAKMGAMGMNKKPA